MDSSIPNAIQTALEHHQAGRLSQAEAIFQQILQKKPSHPDALHFSGLIAFQNGKKDEAVEFISKAIRINPSSLMHYNLAIVLRAQGKLDDAIKHYRRAIVLKPDYAEAYNNIANLLKEQNKLQEAIQHYRKALLLKPDDAVAHNNLGTVLAGLGQLDEAVASYLRALELKRGYTEAYNNLGNVLFRLEHFSEAEANYRRALELKPDYAEAYNNLGNVLFRLERFSEAEACYRRACELKPDYTEAYNNLGNALFSLERFSEAETCYRRACELKPDCAETHYKLGNTLNKQGKLEAAAACFRSCLEIDPQDSFGARFLLSFFGLEPIPLRASNAHLETFYTGASRWDKFLGNNQNYFGAELVADTLTSLSNKSANLDILDAGCGTGQVGVLIHSLASRLDGVDMSPNMLELAKEKRIYDEIHQGDLVSFMEKNPDKYDAIACAATLIHFGDLSPVFNAAAACLKNNGLFVFTIFPNDHEQKGKEVVLAQLEDLAKNGCYAHGKNYVSNLANAAGFVVEKLAAEIHEYFNGKPIMCFVVALRKLRKLD